MRVGQTPTCKDWYSGIGILESNKYYKMLKCKPVIKSKALSNDWVFEQAVRRERYGLVTASQCSNGKLLISLK